MNTWFNSFIHSTVHLPLNNLRTQMFFNLFPYLASNAYHKVSLEREEMQMAFGNVDAAVYGDGKGLGAGIAAIVVIILLLIAMGIVF